MLSDQEIFLTNLVRRLLEGNFIILVRNSEFLLKYGFQHITSLAADLCIHLLKWSLGRIVTFIQDQTTNENSIFNIIKELLIKYSGFCYETIVSFIKAALKFLQDLLVRGCKFSEQLLNKAKKMYYEKSASNACVPTAKQSTTSSSAEFSTSSFAPNPLINSEMDTYFYYRSLTIAANDFNTGYNGSITIRELNIVGNINSNTLSQIIFKPTKPIRNRKRVIKPASQTPENDNSRTSKNDNSRTSKNDNSRTSKNDEVIMGTKITTDTKFTGVVPKCWFYVGRVNIHATEQDIIEQLKINLNLPDENFICKKLVPKLPNGRFQSFRVGVNLNLKEKLESPEVWPHGVAVRTWKNNPKPIKPKEL